MARSIVDLTRSPLERLDRLWAEADVELEYQDALRLALQPAHCEALTSPAAPSLPLTSLPGLCCEASGGSRQQAGEVALAWLLLYKAAHLLDSSADEDGYSPPGPGAGLGINVATGLLVSASQILGELAYSEATLAIQARFYRTVLAMCGGQHVALMAPDLTLEECWRLAGLRSGIFFALACWAGGRLVTGDGSRLDPLGAFGHSLGMLIQLGDDLSGLWTAPGGRSDLVTARRWTLPVAYAMSVLPASERELLGACLKAASTSPEAEAEARRRIVESGAALYLTVEAERRRGQTAAALEAALPPSPARNELLMALDEVAKRCAPYPPTVPNV